MIRKLLIANRGEIACRIIRTCRDMGIATVSVFSDADARALHVEMADEAVRIGAAPASESYLNGAAIIEAAKRTGADAVHPGYGFLSENAAFAQSVIDAGLIWIGPPPNVIALMGDKRQAKLVLKDVPYVPGYMGEDQSNEAFIHAADELGYPLMVKAAAGGGGKGMRLVQNPADLLEALETARREASHSFGNSTLILERAIQNPRHVEVQIFGDTHGNVVALGERECSIQRRHQKVIEETPSTALDEPLRLRMCETAVSIGQQIGYVNAGTVEFILDQERNFYFLEMNTRLQVEHPVTEMVTGVDLVRLQIDVADGGYVPPHFSTHGHAVEVRVYAEDPANDFLPSIGRILHWDEPPADPVINNARAASKVIIDAGVRSGDEVTTHYDPMIAKVIGHGETRDDAIRRLDYTLSQLQLLGIRSNAGFLRRILQHPDFVAGNIDTGFIERHAELVQEDDAVPETALIAAALAKVMETSDAATAGHWRNNPYRPIRQTFTQGDAAYDVLITPESNTARKQYVIQRGDQTRRVTLILLSPLAWERGFGGKESAVRTFALEIDGHRQQATVACGEANDWWVHTPAGTHRLEWVMPLPEGKRPLESAGSLRSPMHGQVIQVVVESGQQVRTGDILLVIEAMKMEHRVKAPYDGIVTAVYYQTGQTVEAGVKLLELQSSE